MPLFQVETYKVSSFLERSDGVEGVVTQPIRLLEMIGFPISPHGFQNRATFAFSSAFDGNWNSPVAGYKYNGPFVDTYVGWFPLAEFSYYYDILRSERPVHVLYELKEEGASKGYLRRIGLGTSTVQFADGPSESIESISAILSEHLTSKVQGLIVPMPILKDLPKRNK